MADPADGRLVRVRAFDRARAHERQWCVTTNLRGHVMNKPVAILTLIAVTGFLTACGASNGDASPSSAASPFPGSGATRAVAVIHPASGSNVHGTVWFQQTS